MRLVCFVLGMFLVIGCGDDDAVVDAGLDTGVDAGFDAGPPDTGSTCAMTCGATESCCVVAGEPVCVEVRDNDDHCGGCDIQCGLEFGRGTECDRQRCQCGRVNIGCRGDSANWCCPSREAGLQPYCANLEQDARDCGDCGNDCDVTQADRCEGGRCRCGLSRDECTGARDSTCCANEFDVGCVDIDNDRDHCGACDRRCGLGESCVAGVCGRAMDGGVDSGTDAAPADAAPADAAPADAAPADAAPADAGA